MNRERPNIVFILTDDQGPWAAGCYVEQLAVADHAEHDGRNLPVAGGGQLRPAGGTWEDGSPAFAAH